MGTFQNNPKWDKAEIILALNLFLNHETPTVYGSSAEMAALSEQLQQLSKHDNIANRKSFRNFNSVGTKLGNLQYLATDGKSGLSSFSKLDKEVWDEYHDKPELVKELAEEILESLSDNDSSNDTAYIDEQEAEYPEGRYVYRMHRQRERNSKAVAAAKAKALHDGSLCCSVCGFDFERTYGELGRGFIEYHHTKPLNQYRKGDVTRVDDLALVCSNCHRMLHRHNPLLSPEELKAMMESE